MFQSANLVYVVTKTGFFSFSQLTVQGLKYLHSQGIAHRDLKPANVLVGNSHYSSLAMEDMGTVFQDRPIICKLTNFGESHLQYAQTHMSMLSLCTSRVHRGMVAYMSPEILLPERTSGPLSMADLMRADVWALGIVFCNLVNPSQRYPYLAEVQKAKVTWRIDDIKMFVSELHRKEAKPVMDSKYQKQRATVWREVEAVHLAATTFPARVRPTPEELDAILKMPDHCDCYFNLKFSQNSALEKSNAQIAVKCANGKQAPGFVDVPNDGTNACAFVAIKIADKIINVFDQKIPSNSFKSIAEVAEQITWFFPQEINDFRDKDQRYDVLCAYNIMNRAKCLVTPYEFSEELVGGDGVFSPTGRQCLL